MSLLEIGGADSIAAFNDALNADWTISGGSKSSVRLSSASLYGIAAIAHISGETPKVRHGAVAPDAMAACEQNTASVQLPVRELKNKLTCVAMVSQLMGDEYLVSSRVFCAVIHPPAGLCSDSVSGDCRCNPHAAITLACISGCE